MRCPTVGLALVLATTPHAALAQPAAGPAPHVFVTLLPAERPFEGTLLHLSADSVAILSDGVDWHYPLHNVTRVERRGDPSYDGAIKGALVGATCLLTCAQGASNWPHLRQLVLTNVAFSAAIGWLIDRARVGRRTLYPTASLPRR